MCSFELHHPSVAGLNSITRNRIEPQRVRSIMNAPAGNEIILYWRPGCSYCMRLRSGLRRANLAVHEVNIWDDPDAASVVRSIADGNETVPTVSVGDQHLVNPSPHEVMALVRERLPHLVPPPARRWWHRRSSDIADRG